MARYRLQPTAAQEAGLAEYCAQARFVWNLAVEQHLRWRPGRRSAPGFAEQCRQLTEARAAFDWLRAGSRTVQEQALRDFAQAMTNFYGRTHRRPTWRKAGVHEGFRIVGSRGGSRGCHWDVRRVSRHVGEVRVPKVGWVRFRWSRPVPDGVKSFRVTRDRARRWHVAFAHIPEPIPAPANGAAVGVDRGVTISAALSTGELLHAPGLTSAEAERLRRLQPKLSRARRGSNRRARVKAAIARLKAREADRRKDWVEKTTTNLARRFDVIAVEDLNVRGMTRSARGTIDAPGVNVAAKAGLNRAILTSGWGTLVQRLERKAPGRVIRVDPRYTSQTCNVCGHRAPENRESQAVFRCVACKHQANAELDGDARQAEFGRIDSLRRIAAWHSTYVDDDGKSHARCFTCDPCDGFPCTTLRNLAGLWRTHPDYVPGWTDEGTFLADVIELGGFRRAFLAKARSTA